MHNTPAKGLVANSLDEQHRLGPLVRDSMWRREAIANWVILLGPAVLGILGAYISVFALHNPSGFIAATGGLILTLYGIGFALFLKAKLSLIRQGISFSFGSARMSPRFRRMYQAGYCMMGLAILLSLAVINATR